MSKLDKFFVFTEYVVAILMIPFLPIIHLLDKIGVWKIRKVE